jgi:hypothetical protein
LIFIKLKSAIGKGSWRFLVIFNNFLFYEILLSGFNTLASSTNVPNGTREAIKASAVFHNDHFLSILTINKKNTYATNKIPWAIPTILTGNGISIMYFNGMAMNISIRKEIPSSKAIRRKVLSDFISMELKMPFI